MKVFEALSLGKLTALFSLGAIGLVFAVNGPRMFSPGELSERNRARRTLGDVASHGEITSHCSACHPAPWSSETMTDRCLTCHDDVRRQIASAGPLHGKLPGGSDCRACHTEHKGPHGRITDLSKFDHAWTGYPLSGKHAAVDCAQCHKDLSYKTVSRTCVSCHAEPTVHKGRFGNNCVQCHTTDEWAEITFVHSFPLGHGRGKKTNTCLTCHDRTEEFSSYTCYNCHEHEKSRMLKTHQRRGMVNIDRCAECHPQGREHDRRRVENKSNEPDAWAVELNGIAVSSRLQGQPIAFVHRILVATD